MLFSELSNELCSERSGELYSEYRIIHELYSEFRIILVAACGDVAREPDVGVRALRSEIF